MDYNAQYFVPQENLKETQAVIFYINDTHGEVNRVTKLKTMHDDFLKKNKGKINLTLGAGDLYLGSDKNRNSAMTKIYNLIKLDYNTAGNHEYDGGSEFLSDNIKHAKFKTVVTNITIPQNNKLNERIKDKKLVREDKFTKNGTKFAILGISPYDKDVDTKDTANKIQVYSLEDTIEVLNQETEKLEKEGINKIILLSHAGYGEKGDIAIAENTKGIDIIIGGHTHTSLNDVSDKNLKYSTRLEPVIITQAGSNNQNVGYLDVLFDKNGVIIPEKINNSLVPTENYSSSKKIQKILDKALGKNEIITKVEIPFLPNNEDEERKQENPIADIMNDGVLQRGIPCGVQVSFFNAPSMKSSEIKKGNLYSYDIQYRILPYNDEICVLELTYEQFLKLLNREAKTVATKDLSNMLHCGGFKYKISMSKAKNGEYCISDVILISESGEEINLDNIENKNQKIICAFPKFLLTDSSLKDIFADVDKSNMKIIGRQQEIFIEQIKKSETLKALKDGRIEIIE